jgi:hypothetical protein
VVFAEHVELYIDIKRSAVQSILKLPFLQSKIKAEISKTVGDFRRELDENKLSTKMENLPEQGLSWEDIDKRLAEV